MGLLRKAAVIITCWVFFGDVAAVGVVFFYSITGEFINLIHARNAVSGVFNGCKNKLFLR